MSADRIVVEVLDSHARVRYRDRIDLAPDRRSFTLGRSTTADVILDDPHVAALHAAVEVAADGSLAVTDLGSLNGVVVDGRRHRGAKDVPVPGGALQVGRTRLRIRSDNEALAPEKPDHGIGSDIAGNASWMVGWAAVLWIALVIYTVWLEAPRDLPTVIASSLTYALAVAAAWVAVWALLSRVLQGEWRWAKHAAVFFGVTAVAFVVDAVLDVAWFSFALPQFDLRDALLWAAGLALLLYGHLSTISSAKRRTLMFFAGALPVLAVGSATWIQARNQARDVNFIDVREQLFPPALRIRAGMGSDEFFTEAATLKQRADDKRRNTPSGDTEGPGSGED